MPAINKSSLSPIQHPEFELRKKNKKTTKNPLQFIQNLLYFVQDYKPPGGQHKHKTEKKGAKLLNVTSLSTG